MTEAGDRLAMSDPTTPDLDSMAREYAKRTVSFGRRPQMAAAYKAGALMAMERAAKYTASFNTAETHAIAAAIRSMFSPRSAP